MKNIIPTFPYEDSLNVVVSSKNRYNKKVGITRSLARILLALSIVLIVLKKYIDMRIKR